MCISLVDHATSKLPSVRCVKLTLRYNKHRTEHISGNKQRYSIEKKNHFTRKVPRRSRNKPLKLLFFLLKTEDKTSPYIPSLTPIPCTWPVALIDNSPIEKL